MSAETELTEALKMFRQENARLQEENARLRDVLSTYPERQAQIAAVLAEMRGLLWQLASERGAVGVGERQRIDEEPFLENGIPPAPDARLWAWQEEGGKVMVPPEATQVEIPQEPAWQVEPEG